MGFRPFRTTPVSVAMPDGRAMAALCAISASGMPISRPSADRPCISRNPCISGAAKMCSACPLCQANRDQFCYRCTAKLLLCNQD